MSFPTGVIECLMPDRLLVLRFGDDHWHKETLESAQVLQNGLAAL